MSRDIHSLPPSGGAIYTLAQSGTGKAPQQAAKPEIIVKGNGTEAQNRERQNNRAKRKMITQKLTLSLIEVANKKGEPERAKKYRNTFYCQNKIYRSGDRLYGNYCKNRFCAVCSGNRKAEIINKYFPVIQTWEAPYFVTLTSKAVPKKWLSGRIFNMLRALKKITDKHRKRSIRGTGVKIMGIRSLECNFNPVERTYNPHFHIIVASREMAEILVSEWLALWGKKFASKKAQKSERVWNKEKALIEIVKYTAKTFTDPTMQKKSKGKAQVKKVTPYVYASAIDNIITAMKGHRVFDRFGFDLPKTGRRPPGGKQTKLTDYTELNYDSHLFDWIDSDTEKALSGYVPSPMLRAIIENNIDKDRE